MAAAKKKAPAKKVAPKKEPAAKPSKPADEDPSLVLEAKIEKNRAEGAALQAELAALVEEMRDPAR